MSVKEILLRMYVKIKGITSAKIFSPEEKQRDIVPKLTEENRNRDVDLFTLDPKVTKGLKVERISLANCNAWILSKEGNAADKIIYYIHGGGFTGACTKERISFVTYLVRNFGYNVFSVDYRLAPEFPFPAPLDDCFDGYLFLTKSFAAQNIFLIGESAGGSLVLALSMLLRDRNLPLPCAVYSNSPLTRADCYSPSYYKYSLKKDFIVVLGILENTKDIYFTEKDEKNPYVSPYYGNLENLPPIILSASNCECLLDDAADMYQKLKDCGNDATLLTYDDLCHAFVISPQMKKVKKRAYPDLDRALKKYLKGGKDFG